MLDQLLLFIQHLQLELLVHMLFNLQILLQLLELYHFIQLELCLLEVILLGFKQFMDHLLFDLLGFKQIYS
jgi:hypothetical protein